MEEFETRGQTNITVNHKPSSPPLSLLNHFDVTLVIGRSSNLRWNMSGGELTKQNLKHIMVAS